MECCIYLWCAILWLLNGMVISSFFFLIIFSKFFLYVWSYFRIECQRRQIKFNGKKKHLSIIQLKATGDNSLSFSIRTCVCFINICVYFYGNVNTCASQQGAAQPIKIISLIGIPLCSNLEKKKKFLPFIYLNYILFSISKMIRKMIFLFRLCNSSKKIAIIIFIQLNYFFVPICFGISFPYIDDNISSWN